MLNYPFGTEAGSHITHVGLQNKTSQRTLQVAVCLPSLMLACRPDDLESRCEQIRVPPFQLEWEVPLSLPRCSQCSLPQSISSLVLVMSGIPLMAAPDFCPCSIHGARNGTTENGRRHDRTLPNAALAQSKDEEGIFVYLND